MELKNYLVELLSNIIHDKLQMLSDANDKLKKSEDYKEIEDLFSDVDKIVNVDSDKLKSILLDITDEDTVSGILSNIEMIKIVLNGKNNGLNLSLDDEQEKLIKGVYEIINDYRTGLEKENNEEKKNLEDFISKCKSLSSEISTGVVRDIDTLDEIFASNDISIDKVIKSKFEILRNNNKNFNLNLEGRVKEEVDLRILMKDYNLDFDSYSDVEKSILVNECDIPMMNSFIEYIVGSHINLSSSQLFFILLFSNLDIFSNIIDLSKSYDFSLSDLFKIPGVFVSKEKDVSSILSKYNDMDDFYIVENYLNVVPCYELFVDNISLLEANNRSVSECFKNNILSLIVPDLEKNITILSDIKLSNKEFSIVVINPFLATSYSSFNECGLGDYLKENPLRLTTSYYRLKNISSNIVLARKNSQPIFRSLNDKKTYWLNRNITCGVEVK